MRSTRRRGGALCCYAIVLCTLLATLADSAFADERSIAVWYRSTDNCPDGAAFLRTLEARAVRARLAQVGDAIDFVVTLGADATHGSSGVLERQTAAGTVALRRVDDVSCEQVAEALSLTLALAVQSSTDEVASAQRAVPIEAPEPAVTGVAESAPAPAAATPKSASTTEADRAQPAPVRAVSRLRVSAGLGARVATGIAPSILPGGSVFADLAWKGARIWQPALRVAASVAYASGDRAGETLDVRVAAGRVEGCPIELGGETLAFRPCVGLELGQIHSAREGASGRGDSGVWVASELLGRTAWPAASAVDLEAQLGVAALWTRYELSSSDDPPRVLHRTAALSATAGIGLVVHFE